MPRSIIKEELLAARVAKNIRSQVKKAAEAQGISPSEWLRVAIIDKLKSEGMLV